MRRRFPASVSNGALGNLESESMTACDELAPFGLKKVRSSNYPWIIPEWVEKLDQRDIGRDLEKLAVSKDSLNFFLRIYRIK